MKIKLITAAIISINLLLLIQDIPLNIIAMTISGLLLSLFFVGKKIRIAIKISLLILSMALLRYHFKTLLVTECGVSFVLILASLKFWELDEERDHFNMFLILALSECSIYLLNPTFIVFIFGLIKMIFYFYYILKIRNYDIALLNPKRLMLLVTPSIILSLLLFYTFPRFTQGFINVSDMQYIISGASSKLNFKELGPMGQSKEISFKVYGLGESRLPFSLLYWRSSVLWQLEGQEWRTSNSNLKQPNPILVQPQFKYNVELLQNFKEYMPILDGSASIIFSSQNFNSYSEGSFRLKAMSRENLNYTVVGNYGDRPQYISPLLEKKGLRIKSHRKNEIKDLYFSQVTNSSNDEVRLRELVQIFKNKNFEYNISPPSYSSIEDFLIHGKSGYCSHFAAAFTYLARLYDLPSRIVVGYLGGELNPYDNSIIIRELDAHAWSEVFIKEKGWVKIDPTVLVAPERATMSALQFNNKIDPYITILNLKISRELLDFSSLNNLSLWIDSLNSKFNNNIFNFDRDKQLAILRSLTPGKLSVGWIFVISLISFLIIFWITFNYYGKIRLSPNERRYKRFLQQMQSKGTNKAPYETISTFRLRCLKEHPDKTDYIDSEVSHYLNSFYK